MYPSVSKRQYLPKN